jgi:hypothetical protein
LNALDKCHRPVTCSPAKSSSPNKPAQRRLVYIPRHAPNLATATYESTSHGVPLPHRPPPAPLAAHLRRDVDSCVAVAALAPELAFIWAVGPGTPLSKACAGSGDGTSVGLPLDGPLWDVVCLPAGMFGRAPLDIIVPLVFATVVVASVGVLEDDDDANEDGETAAATMEFV